MAYNYKINAYTSKNKDQIDDFDNQIANHDQTYDNTKDAGWIAADKQIKSAANVLASQERGRMGNRIGAKTSWEDFVSASILTEAEKNSQNLIPTYQQMALEKLKSQRDSLAQREQQDYNNWLASESLNMQNYAQQLTQQNADRAYRYQVDRDAIEDVWRQKNYDLQLDQFDFQKDQYNDSKNATPSINLSDLAKFAQIDADYGTNYVNQLFGATPNATNTTGTPSNAIQSGAAAVLAAGGTPGATPNSGTKTYTFTNSNISGLRNSAKEFVNGLKGEAFTEPQLRQLILNNAEEYDLEINDIKNIYQYLGLDSAWINNYTNKGLLGWGLLGKGIKIK